MNPRPAVPSWLSSAHSPGYITSAFGALAKRERSRDQARKVSHRQSDSSRIGLVAHPSSTQRNPKVEPYSVSVAHQLGNRNRNRYTDVTPYDRTRVIVESDGSGITGGGGRYLNANWVRERLGGKWWIASQAPLPGTSHAFLSLITQPTTRPPQNLHSSTLTSRQSRIRTVVQLTQNVENGRRKADTYFPSSEGLSWVISPEEGCETPSLKVTLLRARIFSEAHCIHSLVSITPISSKSVCETITFHHMLYTAWPDHGVPEPDDRAGLLAFLRLVETTNRDISSIQDGGLDLDPDPPIIVGCSAGIGRTGSFIALSSLLRGYGLILPSHLAETPSPHQSNPLPPSTLGPLPDEFKDDLIVQEVDSLREQRSGMVQREEQISLIYDVLTAVFLDFEREHSEAK